MVFLLPSWTAGRSVRSHVLLFGFGSGVPWQCIFTRILVKRLFMMFDLALTTTANRMPLCRGIGHGIPADSACWYVWSVQRHQ